MINLNETNNRSAEPRTEAGGTRSLPPPPAPAYESLPKREARSGRRGPALGQFSVAIEVVTPILGGADQPRTVDEVDVIRPATVRGHLRFWWRALRGHEFVKANELYGAESALWGRAATDEGGRSAVEIRIAVEKTGATDPSDIQLYGSKEGKATEGAYALFPARSETKRGISSAPRRRPGTRFRLTLIAPKSCEEELRNVVRAWLLFGGYGSRTRRGLGSLTVLDDRGSWLPSQAAREAIQKVFGSDILAPPERAPGDTPWLGGAALHVGPGVHDAVEAWTAALGWLAEFRQGTKGQPGERAREPGTGNRPSISNWPEADKVRHLKNKTKGHEPRHNETVVWPRAGFGLPIIGQFQEKARDGNRLDEPDGFELRWRSADGTEHDRLASPLIVKALPLADGTFVPCALWLNRACPAGQVILRGVENSAAPFDQLVADGDTPPFSALSGKRSLREAFLDWLKAKHQTTEVAP